MTTRLLWLLPAVLALALVACSSTDQSVRGPGPGPRSTPFPSPAALAASYRAALAPITAGYATELRAIALLSSAPNITDAQWRIDYKGHFQTIKGLHAQAQRLVPPTCLASAHTEFMKASSLLDQAATHALTAVDTISATEVATTTRLLDESTAQLTRATAQASTAGC